MPLHITVESINAIAALNDPVLRNLEITQCYCELSAAFAQRMGEQANWCTFATWASKQAGQTIRREDLQNTIENLLHDEPEIKTALSLIITLAKQKGAKDDLDRLSKTSLAIIVASIANRAADATGRGNQKVFAEIAPEFARFMDACFNDLEFIQSSIDAFGKHLQRGLPPNGQDYLRKAFSCYYQALFENDPKKKTELNFMANLQVGFHEQNRLQPEIAEALNASAIDMEAMKDKLISHLFSGSGFWARSILFSQRVFGKTILDKAIEALLERVQHHIRLILTDHLMTITLPPDNCLHLGKDLTIQFPLNLQLLSNPGLIELLTHIDPTTNSVSQSGAIDWCDLNERMHFITDMFRCYHADEQLFDEAFSTDQLEELKQGKIPRGSL